MKDFFFLRDRIMLTYVFFVFFFVFPVISHYFNVTGNTPYEIGHNMGTQMKELILEFYDLMSKDLSQKEISEWKELANRILPNIEKYAPLSYEEMRGAGDVSGLSLEMISMMNCNYEFQMIGVGRKRKGLRGCTGFVSSFDGKIITGQTNDENPIPNMEKNGFVVLQRNEESVVYTKPGLLIFMGMSRTGIVSLYQYVDNGEYAGAEDIFLPSVVVLREILKFDNLGEILEYLRDTPQGVPGNHMVSKSNEGFLDVELSFTNFSAVYQPVSKKKNKFTDYCHTNNFIIDQAMIDGDFNLDPTSRPRFETCRNMTKKFRQSGGMTVERVKEMYETSPIKRDGKWENVQSCEKMIFEPDIATMHIRWYQDKEYEIFKLI